MKKLIIFTIIFLFLIPNFSYSALVDGTNVGFVTVAPTSDPLGADGPLTIDNRARAIKATAPSGATSIVEIGWWCANASEAANFDVGIYSDNGGGASSVPSSLLYSVINTAKGTTEGWKTATTSYSITEDTIYWIAVHVDNTSTGTTIDSEDDVLRRDYDSTATSALNASWNSSGDSDNVVAIYAVYETGSGLKAQIF